MDKEQLKQFAKKIMEDLNLSGGRTLKLIQKIAPQYEYDEQKIKVQIKRAIIGQH